MIPADIPTGWATIAVAVAGLVGVLAPAMWERRNKSVTAAAATLEAESTSMQRVVDSALAVLERTEERLTDCLAREIEQHLPCIEELTAERERLRAEIVALRLKRNG